MRNWQINKCLNLPMEYKPNGSENSLASYFREDSGNLYHWKETGYNSALTKSHCKIIQYKQCMRISEDKSIYDSKFFF